MPVDKVMILLRFPTVCPWEALPHPVLAQFLIPELPPS